MRVPQSAQLYLGAARNFKVSAVGFGCMGMSFDYGPPATLVASHQLSDCYFEW
jgi:aryl-alcohol dehydrogenase-like predicted oxidoreductase